MFRLGDLVILLHLVPALPRVITHGVEEVGRIAPRPQVDDGAVLLEVDTPPVPWRVMCMPPFSMEKKRASIVLSHFFGTSVESERRISCPPSSEDGVGMFEIIITVIRDKERRLLPGSARIAAVRSLEIGSDTDYRAFRERYQYTLYESPVCLPITSKVVPKTLYKVVPLRMYRLYVERGAIIRGGRALIELLPSRRMNINPSAITESAPTTLLTASPTAM